MSNCLFAQNSSFAEIEKFPEDLVIFTNRLNQNANYDFLLERYLANYNKLDDSEKNNVLEMFKFLSTQGSRIKSQSVKYIFIFNYIIENDGVESISDFHSVTNKVLTQLNEKKINNYFSSLSNYVQDSLIYSTKYYNIKPSIVNLKLKFIPLESPIKVFDSEDVIDDSNTNSSVQDIINNENSNDDEGFGNDNADDDGFGNDNADDDGFGNDNADDDGFGNDNADDDGFGNDNADDDGFGNDNTDDDGFGNDNADDDGFGNDNADDDGFGNDNIEAQRASNAQDNVVSQSFIKRDIKQEYIRKAPPLVGPVIELDENVDLLIQTKSDTTQILNTKGWILLGDKGAIFEGGRVDWKKRELPEDSVFMDLNKFYFNFLNNGFDGQGVFTNKFYLDRQIEGIYEYKVEHKKKKYPKFTSYTSDININYKGNEGIKFTGGFTLEGTKVYTTSISSNKSNLEVLFSNDKYFIATGENFSFHEKVIESPKAEIKLYFEGDSLIHPSRRLIYSPDSMELKLLKPKSNRYKEAPYSNNFFGVNLYGDILLWNLKADSITLSTLQARSQIPAFVESDEFFMKKRFVELRGFNKFHPLLVVVGYGKKINSNTFNIDNLMAYSPTINEKLLENSLIFLSNMGFISYEKQSGGIVVYDRALHYVRSIQKKKDYDNLLIASTIDSKYNIIYRINEKELAINGVHDVTLSEKLGVFIIPSNKNIILNKGKDFKFEGAVSAGNFQYYGKDFDFQYDNFLINLNAIDSIQMYKKVELPDGSFRRERIKNTISGGISEVNDQTSDPDVILENVENENQDDVEGNGETDDKDSKGATQDYSLNPIKGVLLINDPKNKSGIKDYKKFPLFTSDGETFIYFNHPDILNGVYGRKFYFEVPQLNIDSANRGDKNVVNFDGQFNSGGILPTFAEKLLLMEDNTMGFVHQAPEEGYKIQEDQGTFYNTLKIDGNGLRGDGRITYLSLDIKSDDFIFYPDSITTQVSSYLEMKSSENDDTYPDFNVENYKMHWNVKTKDFRLRNIKDKFKFFKNTGDFSGEINVKENGVTGKGVFEMAGSYTVSKEIEFRKSNFLANKALFKINPDKNEKPILDANDVKVNFDILEKKVNIAPEKQGVAAMNFPYAQIKTSIPEAIWDLEENKIVMQKQDSIVLKDSYFYSTRKELDSLAFNAEYAEYDIDNKKLNISGIPFIRVVDAKITPNEGKITMLANSQLEKLHNATIELDTLNAYHKLINANIDIISRNKFEGDALLKHTTPTDTFMIKIDKFELVDYPISKSKKEFTQHTNGYGTILEIDSVTLAPKFLYKGDVTLEAHKKSYILDGYTKIILKNNYNFDEWLRYTRTGSSTYISVNYNEIKEASKDPLLIGMYLNNSDFSIEHKFFDVEIEETLVPFFQVKGRLSFDYEANRFRIENRSKSYGKKYNGNIYTVNEDTKEFYYEGNFDFSAGFDGFPVSKDNSVVLEGIPEKNTYRLKAMIGLDFNLPKAAIDIIHDEILIVSDNIELEAAYQLNEDFFHLIGAVEGNKTANNFKKANEKDYSSFASHSQIMTQSLVFSEINFIWDHERHSFRSTGEYLHLSHLEKKDANVKLKGSLEIVYDINFGPVLNLHFIIGDYWYFFGFKENQLSITSNNDNYLVSLNTREKKKKTVNSYETLVAESNIYESFISNFNNSYPSYKSEDFTLKRHEPLPENKGYKEEIDDKNDDTNDEEEIKKKKKRKKKLKKRKKEKKKMKPNKDTEAKDDNIDNNTIDEEDTITDEKVEEETENKQNENINTDDEENEGESETQELTKEEKKAKKKAEKLRKKEEKQRKKETEKKKKETEKNDNNTEELEEDVQKEEPTDNEGF